MAIPTQGHDSLLALAAELRERAVNVESFFDHRAAADTMRRAANTLERIAPLDPEIECVEGEN